MGPGRGLLKGEGRPKKPLVLPPGGEELEAHGQVPLKPRGEGEGGQAREVRPHGVEVLPVHGEGIAPGPEGEGGVGGGGEEEEVHLPEEGLGLGLEALLGPKVREAPAGGEPSVVVNKVLEGKGNFGYNAATGEYGDMLEMGILDPTKVTRSALQAAGSVAGLMLTTECMIAEHPEEKPAGGGGGHAGTSAGYNNGLAGTADSSLGAAGGGQSAEILWPVNGINPSLRTSGTLGQGANSIKGGAGGGGGYYGGSAYSNYGGGAGSSYIFKDAAAQVLTPVNTSGDGSLEITYIYNEPVTNLTAMPGDKSVQLSWDPHPMSGLTAYRVFGGTSPNPTAVLGTTASTFYNHASLTKNLHSLCIGGK